MKNLQFVAITHLVGMTPRVEHGLRDELGVPAENWHLFDPFLMTPKPWGYPVTIAAPLPGVHKRRQKMLDATNMEQQRVELRSCLSDIRHQHPNDRVVGVAWSIGAWLAGMVQEQGKDSKERFDALILISPMLTLPVGSNKGVPGASVHPQVLASVPTLLLVGTEDEAVENAAQKAQRITEAGKPNVELRVLTGAKHSFDQERLREGGKMKNPDYKSTFANQATAAIRLFLERL